jgi:hypothetical protein
MEIHLLTGLSALNVDDPGVIFAGWVAAQDTTTFRVHPHSVDDAPSSPNGGKVKHHRRAHPRAVPLAETIAERTGVSQMQVSRILASTLKSLRDHLG